jgi:hypothetical protein
MLSYPIDPFADGPPINLTGLMKELAAAREAVNELSVEPKVENAEIGQRAAERAAHYGLAENDRHPSIKNAAEAIGEATHSFAAACDAMNYQHAVVANHVRSRIARYMMKAMSQNMKQLGEGLAEAARRSDFAAINTVLANAAAGFDATSKEFLGGIFLETLLAGSLTDVGNAFVNLHETRNVAMQRYANGEEPHGWRDRLPRPLKAVFTETTCITLEKGVEIFFGQALPGVIPMGAAIVGVGRLAFEIRKDHRQEQLAFRRDDVDEMLDLADQLAEAANVAQRHIEIVREVDLVVK